MLPSFGHLPGVALWFNRTGNIAHPWLVSIEWRPGNVDRYVFTDDDLLEFSSALGKPVADMMEQARKNGLATPAQLAQAKILGPPKPKPAPRPQYGQRWRDN